MTTCLIEPTWMENMGTYFIAHVVKLWCSFFFFDNWSKIPINGSPWMVVIKIQTHWRKILNYIQSKKNLEVYICALSTKLCYPFTINLLAIVNCNFWNMRLFKISKKILTELALWFSISTNCKVFEASSRYETILEELKGKKGSYGGRFFFLKRREVMKWTRIQDMKNMMNTIETPFNFFPTISSKAISQQVAI